MLKSGSLLGAKWQPFRFLSHLHLQKAGATKTVKGPDMTQHMLSMLWSTSTWRVHPWYLTRTQYVSLIPGEGWRRCHHNIEARRPVTEEPWLQPPDCGIMKSLCQLLLHMPEAVPMIFGRPSHHIICHRCGGKAHSNSLGLPWEQRQQAEGSLFTQPPARLLCSHKDP